MRRLFLGAILLAASACKDPPPACIAVETACSPLYPPTTFANVYSMTIVRQCGSDKGSCHSASGDSALSLATEQEAFDGLLANHVTPGDPGCSELVVRTSSPGADYQMPKGSPLIESEQCALRKWVEAGAPR
ncbi:MAG: hypothetical protein IPQ07_01370 [Myxococcales bacterium]|nr:hypothetical protein [Myxococcales bacterium]